MVDDRTGGEIRELEVRMPGAGVEFAATMAEPSEPAGCVVFALGVLLRAGLPAVLIMIASTVPAILFGFHARRSERVDGLIPAIIGIVAAAYAILANALPLVIAR